MKDNLKSENKNIKLLDWLVCNRRFKWKIIEYFMSSKKNYFFLKLLTKKDTLG